MGLIEESLRETFAAQVAATPSTEDAATQAISAGHRVRRRRHTLAVAAVTATVVLGGVGVAATLRGAGRGTPVMGSTASMSPLPPLPVDVLAGNRIIRTDGTAIGLPGLAEPQRLWRVQGGWLVQTWDAEASLAAVWHVDEAGAPRLLAAGDRAVVGRGLFNGPRVAWKVGDQVWFANLVDGTLQAKVSTPVGSGLGPVAIVGTGVLLGSTGNGPTTQDMWFPAQGDYVADPPSEDQFLGESGDRSAYFGVQDGDCLVKVNPYGLSYLRRVCGLDVGSDHRAYASPDLHWLTLVGPDRVSVYNLDSVWVVPQQTQLSWSFTGTGVAWPDDGTVVVGGLGKIVQISIDDPYQRSDITVATGPLTPVWPAEELRF